MATAVGPGTHTVVVEARKGDAGLGTYFFRERTLVAEATIQPA